MFVAGFIGMANLLPATIERLEGGHAVARIAGDRAVRGPAAEGLKVDDPGHADDPPERMHLRVDDPPPGLVSIPAEVVDLVFQGPVVRFDLRTPDGSPIVAHVGPEDDSAAAPTRRPGLGVPGSRSPAACCRRREHVAFSPDPQAEEIASLNPATTGAQP